jgi:L,D-transpeptidase ErfK/SrfK
LDAPAAGPVPSAPAVSKRQVRPPEAQRFEIAAGEDIFGSLWMLPLHEDDTLPDVARHYGLGYEELASANPDVDPWVPARNSKVLIPLGFVLPKAPRKGIVINLAAMRLFHFPTGSGGGRVVTYPVGIGREGRSSPTGPLSILKKKDHPTWYPTANIRADHRRKGDPLPAAVSPGPDNPLGDYALYLSRQPYLIHGTNKPYSVGWRASNGCIRLYPEHIEQLFPEVPVREPVLIVNQPYLIGWRNGVL